ncbi:MAG TPA: VWA domain-containing protein [Pyrinomonadaceae bacterium]|nr:VWA domain-containing protein [Pyrinomonadaceae bacterium]
MVRHLIIVLLIIAACGFAAAQSGRRVTPPATPAPIASDDGTPRFSESKPRSRRTRAERFPGVALPGNGQSSQSANIPVVSSAPDDGEVLKIETNLITIPVSVFDKNGLYIPGLRQSEFKIFEDNVEQEIAYFGTTDKPFTVALVLDVSPSTAYKIDEIRRAATAFVDQLGPDDTLIVIEFDHSVNVLAKATKDRPKIYKAISKADFGDGTSLYNAVDEALRKQLGPIPGRKAMVLFTDGVDTTSRKNSYDSTLNYAEESDSLIFPIYYNTYFDNRRTTTFPFPDIWNPMGTNADDYALGRRYLEELADATGGRVFRPESTPGGLTRAFEGIAEELRRQYNVGYVPTSEGKRGQVKQIRVRVERPGLIVRARDSYVVGSAPVLAPQPSPSPVKQL